MALVCHGRHDHVRQADLPMNDVRRGATYWFRLRKDRRCSDNLVSDAGRRLEDHMTVRLI